MVSCCLSMSETSGRGALGMQGKGFESFKDECSVKHRRHPLQSGGAAVLRLSASKTDGHPSTLVMGSLSSPNCCQLHWLLHQTLRYHPENKSTTASGVRACTNRLNSLGNSISDSELDSLSGLLARAFRLHQKRDLQWNTSRTYSFPNAKC